MSSWGRQDSCKWNMEQAENRAKWFLIEIGRTEV